MNRKQPRAATRHQVPADRAAFGTLPTLAQRAFAEATQLHQAGRLAEAIRAYRHSLTLFPSQPEAHQNLGNALSDLGQPTEALACFERALSLHPAYPVAHLNRGNAFWALGPAGWNLLIRQYHPNKSAAEHQNAAWREA